MTLSGIADELRTRIQGRVEEGVRMARLTTYRLGGPAALYIEPESRDELDAAAEVLRSRGPGVPVLALGRGSNLVVSDEGFDGVVLRLGSGFARIQDAGDRSVAAGGAAPLPLLANWTARRGLSGLEFTIAIPGSVGGGVRMNAGAHGGAVGDVLTSASILDVETLETERRDAVALDLRYRHSNLRDGEVVLDATFELEQADAAEVRARLDGYRRHRAETQPPAVQNAGSVFKNPPGDHAGRLVEAAGLKGFSVGGASVSRLHANFFVAAEGARAQDVYDLVFEVRARVVDAFGIDLEPEVRFVGSFTAPESRARSMTP